MADGAAAAAPMRALAALALLAWATGARAETVGCTVMASIPIVIDTPGHYCIDQDFETTNVGAFVQIVADDVVFDCNGHTLRNTTPTNWGTGVFAGDNRSNVTVRDCTLDGFGTGIYLSGSVEPGAQGNTLRGNQVLRSGYVGIQVWGSGNLIAGNRVTGNTAAQNGAAYGIYLISGNNQGIGNVIRDNIVADFKVTPPGAGASSTGIFFGQVHNTEVTGNHVSGLYTITGQTIYALQASDALGSVVANNTVLSAPPRPAPYDAIHEYGIILFGPLENHSLNVCRDNVVGHWNLNISGCVNTGNTEF